MFTCWMCASTNVKQTLEIPEMHLGTGEVFTYNQCQDCNSLQIADIPSNLGSYYPSDYYSFKSSAPAALGSPLRRYLRARRSEYMLGHASLLGWLVNLRGKDYFNYEWDWFRQAKVRLDSRILDVGCGAGGLLRELREFGFTRLYGIDPFVPEAVELPGLQIRKCQFFDLHGQFDFIMLHHSLEHMSDPLQVLRHFKTLLAPGGTILMRVPVAGCAVHRNYGVYWYQLDAPRHLFVPTVQGGQALVQQAGLEIGKIQFDSGDGQFIYSEGYRQGSTLEQMRRQGIDSLKLEPRSVYRQQSQLLNQQQDGDQACFYLRHA